MPEYLLTHGRSDTAVVEAMAVAEDLYRKQDAQVDFAVPAERREIAELCLTWRRVVAVDIAPAAVPRWPSKLTGGGWRDKLRAAAQSGELLDAVKSGVKNITVAAHKNFRQYRDLLDDLRLPHYDAVIDLDASALSMLIARTVKAQKIIGFAAADLPNAPAGTDFMYHQTQAMPKNLSSLQRCRHLAARALGYEPNSRPAWNIKPCPPPKWLPATPFILIGGEVPEPFVKVAAAAEVPLLGDFADATIKPPAAPSITELAALAQAAVVVIGNGTVVALATAVGAQTVFIGGKKDAPDNALLAESPAALQKALHQHLSPKKEATPPTAPSEEEASASAPAETPSPPASTDSGTLRIKS